MHSSVIVIQNASNMGSIDVRIKVKLKDVQNFTYFGVFVATNIWLFHGLINPAKEFHKASSIL